jgi:hypothetical protein
MEARESPEATEGVAAYNEKRPPNWAVSIGGMGAVPSLSAWNDTRHGGQALVAPPVAVA